MSSNAMDISQANDWNLRIGVGSFGIGARRVFGSVSDGFASPTNECLGE